MNLPSSGGVFNPAGVPKPLGMYSHIGHAAASSIVFLAGQLSVDEEGRLIGRNDFRTQVDKAFENLGALLRSIDATFDNIVNFNTYLARPEDVEVFFAIRRELFPRLFVSRQYPPNNLFVLRQLFHPDYLFEIVAVAAIGASRGDG